MSNDFSSFFPKEATSGIYAIINTVNQKVYIGQSICIRTRWSQHLRELNNRNHFNKLLQQDWDYYGQSKFIFKSIQNVVPNSEALNQAESYWINWYESLTTEKGYNHWSPMVANGANLLVVHKCYVYKLGQWELLIRKSDDYFFATGIASVFGKNASDFSRQKSIKQFDSLIESDSISTYKGTWVDFGLLTRFAKWLNPAFEVEATRLMKKIYLTTNLNPMKNIERILNNGL